MTNKLFKRTIFLAVLVISIIISSSFGVYATEDKNASNEAVKLYADYGDGFEFLTELYFEKDVTEQSVMIDYPITELRVVRGVCYDLNLDRLTLNGVCPVGYERKLSATDNDLLEIEDSKDFILSGKGELVISARAPKEIKGENYSIKFPKHNIGKFTPASIFYNYTLGSNLGTILDNDDLQIPSSDFFFTREMCYPDSGHPDAPIDFYVANDDNTLYVFFEAFVDNTLDNGKDFAGVHVKCGDTVKTYKVYTTESNENGRWWFEYTDSSDEYDWQHMSYLVKIPLSEIDSGSDKLDIGFEYYGTVSAHELLERLGVDGEYYVTQELMDAELQYAQEHNQAPYYDETVRILPLPGHSSNVNDEDAEEGEWWITNTGTENRPKYTLTLNGATIDKLNAKYSSYEYIYPYGSLTIELVEGTTNSIGKKSVINDKRGMDISASQDVIIQGEGTLNVYGKVCVSSWTTSTLTICDGATVNIVGKGFDYNYPEGAIHFDMYYDNNIVIDDATLTVTHTDPSKSVYGIECGGDVTLENGAVLEISIPDEEGNYGLLLNGLGNLVYDEDIAVVKEGNSANDADIVDELTDVNEADNRFYSMPYVYISQKAGFSVTFDSNGGSGEMDRIDFDEETEYKLPRCKFTAPKGKAFLKWNLGKVGSTITVDEDIVLVAQWQSKESAGTPIYTITTKVQNGTIKPENPKVKRTESKTIEFKADEGYEIADVLVDNESIGIVEKYTFTDVKASHKIEVKTQKTSAILDVDEEVRDEVIKAEAKGLIPESFAKKDGTKSITRLEFAAVAVKVYEAISKTTAKPVEVNPFTDTDDEYVLKAYAIGITSGTSETTFTPNAKISREQMVTMLVNALRKAGINVSVDLEKVNKFDDDSELRAWSKEAAYFTVEEKIVDIKNNKFNALGLVKIQEAIVIALRSVEL